MGQAVMANDGHQLQGITIAVRGNDAETIENPITGCSVEDHLVNSRATWREVVDIICKITLALDYAHHQGHLYGTLQSSDIKVFENGDSHRLFPPHEAAIKAHFVHGT